MANPEKSTRIFHANSVDQDEISPSYSIRRTRRTRRGSVAACELIYTENLWAASNNTLVGSKALSKWQSAKHWVIVTDDAHRGSATHMLGGCEAIAQADSDMVMVKPNLLSKTLLNLSPEESIVVLLAVENFVIPECVRQFDTWFTTCESNDKETSQVNLLWLPHDRAMQTLPADTELDSLPWASMTTVCDLSKLTNNPAQIKSSLVTMLRSAVFIDAQFAHWLEGNLSAMSEINEELHRQAIMRTANAMFTMKRRRSDEPNIPMSFTHTAALLYTTRVDNNTPQWQIQARQLMLDVQYAVETNGFSFSAAERIQRIMTSLQLIDAAKDASIVNAEVSDPTQGFEAFLVLDDIGNAIISQELDVVAWKKVTR